MATYHFFWNGPFSQWYKSEFTENGKTFCTAEQYMMYQKAMLMGDPNTAARIMQTNNPRVQKQLGREIQGFNAQLWDENKERIVYEGNMLKFTQNPELKEALMDTGESIIVEASPVDSIWGIGMDADHAIRVEPSKWPGLNLLGKAIMKVRGTLKSGTV
jgi:hypothetical protein